ncbi:Component linked with the assembly of cytochrome' ABC transporter ATP-binding protein CydC [Mycolicibacterium phlei]|jgi:ATP-binding cassette subfamily C protein CydC|uniref:ABC transporter ATP-binding protein n=1 Tax=Mycolicibacterium phlei DSM 43239 = CCUG 21000 TaxID=1226750 RepID=A0A5N5V6M7_MYCPH|nr:ATP-binding cassette domain-containing protein [Mycolicibacterium phlei]VEG09705.1 Component linked with the assembly of cytochrome' ABC transporter ATP-binding protein CydC [Mycobacteroides chelonae]AMO61597.1 putative ABC transporter ATP-binding protein [Mycolicibacterium phlei]EID18084.1 cysteine export CydDC family ABC transporter permease subunit/ATP-binding protein CydC [Mycolicibacterium phlei RIVM601174]KAB7757582.1 ABC transporter ATP-binding protein [Mycolicibacterium phlei DSM 432
MREVLRARLPRLALAILLGVLSLGSALALAAISAWLITRAWQMPPVLHLTVAVVAVRALGISRGVLGYCQRLAAHDTALRSAADIREAVYRRLAAAPVETTMRLPAGELVARVGAAVDDLADVLVRAVLPIAVAAVLGVAAVVAIALISPAAAVVLAVCLLVAGVVAPWLAARAARDTEAVAAEHHSDRDVAVMLALEHAPELRVGGRLDAVLAEANRRHRDWGAATDRAARPAAAAGAVSTLAIGASVVGAVVAGFGIANIVAPTTLAILMLLPLSAFEATTALPAAAVQLTRSRIAARRIAELTAPDAAARTRPEVPPIVLKPGERRVITGPSGSGKTTQLLKLAETYPDAVFLAEDAHLFETTVRDNLLVARGDATDDEIRSALRRVGLGQWLDGLPDGLSTVLVGGAAAVSAGQRRRLLLARALLTTAPIVLLDEPTEHLDAADGSRILTELLTPGGLFPAERTVVIATHHLPQRVTSAA